MKISELWLREWVNPSIKTEQLAAQLTMAGLEVDAIVPVAGDFSGVIVAEVIKTQPHPQADKLTLCEVNTGENQSVRIVCGAANVREGLKVALATVGARLPGNVTIKEAKLRGEHSQGMLCSVAELGMADQSEGIMELDKNAPTGKHLRDYLKLDDHIIDINLTPNRADCFSILGIAREAGALNQLPLKQIQPKITPEIDDALSINLMHPEACPHYCARIIRGLNPHARTPSWMSEKLRRCGIRLVHPVVDVLNYVMFELGQPMHAFDLATLKDDISVRYSNEQEKIELLDGQTICLDKEVLVIADNEKPLAIAGIMGGSSSAVQEETTDVLIESAYFNPMNIATVARRFGLCTDASQRFERGVDSQLQVLGLERATELLQTIAGGRAAPVVTVSNEKLKPKTMNLSFQIKKVKQLTGVDISSDNVKSILQSLGMHVTDKTPDIFDVTVPSYRFDICIEEDLVEEIIRVFGYDNMRAQPANYDMKAGKSNHIETLNVQLADWFSHRGYHESVSYSFVDPQLQEAIYPQNQPLSLLNPISCELSQMRAGMWPGLIASMVYNAHRQQQLIKLFERGVVFKKENNKIIEEPVVAGLLTGERGSLNWSEATRQYDFYDLKGDLQALFNHLNLQTRVTFIPEKHPACHPGQTAAITIDGIHAGWLGVLHPKITNELDMQQPVILFELSLTALMNAKKAHYQPISKYPQIRRDLSFLVAETVTAQDIQKVICEEVKDEWLNAIELFDVYQGKGIPEGKKSLGVAIILQDPKRTLIDAEINELISAILKKLENNFAIILRD